MFSNYMKQRILSTAENELKGNCPLLVRRRAQVTKDEATNNSQGWYRVDQTIEQLALLNVRNLQR